MTRGEALKKMQAVKAYMTSGNPIWDVTEIGEAFGMAIEALEQPEQRWIPCSERLPTHDEYDETFIVTMQCEHVDGWPDYVACASDWTPHGWDTCGGPLGAIKVVAWMPLPEPYKGEA